MKSAKKILALILAGVMALALLTGCGKATSLDRTIAEGIAEYHKSELAQLGGNNNNISVSYQVPELRRDIAPLFDENWITKGRKMCIRDRVYSQLKLSEQQQARMPLTLFAAMLMPTPVPQNSSALLHWPLTTASQAGRAMSG